MAARAGVQVISGLVGNVTIPRTTTTSTGHWLELESSQVTESQWTLGRCAGTEDCGEHRQRGGCIHRRCHDAGRAQAAVRARTRELQRIHMGQRPRRTYAGSRYTERADREHARR